MARDTCPRCGVTLHTTATPPGDHVCKDLAVRAKRQAAQVDAVAAILGDALDGYGDPRQWAELIVERLNRLGITED